MEAYCMHLRQLSVLCLTFTLLYSFPSVSFCVFYVCVCFYVIASVCCLWALLPELK